MEGKKIVATFALKLSFVSDYFNQNCTGMTMLEYCKMILEKVSFDPNLFRTELYKAFSELVAEEVRELKTWCVQKFGWNYCVKADPGFTL